MRFNITRSSIEALEQRGEITIIDALNVFFDLCEDVKAETGTPVFRLPVGSEEESVGRLNWAGRTIMRIADKNPEILASCDKGEKYRKIEEELQQYVTSLAQKEEELKEVLQRKAEVNGEAEKLAAKAKELQLRRSQLEQAMEECKAVEESCRQLEEEIVSCENSDLVQLRMRKSALEERLDEVKERITEAVNENISLKAKVDEQEELLHNEQTHRENMRVLLEEKEKHLKEEITVLDSEIVSLQAKIEEEETAAKAKQEMKNAKELEWENAKRERMETEAWFASLNAKEKEAQMNTLLQRVSVLKKAKEALLKELPLTCTIVDDDEAALLNRFIDYYHKELDDIEKNLETYQTKHNQIVRIAEHD